MSSESIVSVLPGETISKRMRHILSRARYTTTIHDIYSIRWSRALAVFISCFFFYVVFIYMLQHSSASSQKHRNSTSSSSCYDVEWAHLLLLLCIPRWDASISDDDVLSLTWTLPKFCAVDVILLNRCRYRRTAKTVVGVGSGSFSRGRLLYRRSFVSTSWYLFVETPKAPFRY